MSNAGILWSPSERHLRESNIAKFSAWAGHEYGLNFESYEQLWQWSVERLEDFWGSVWRYFRLSAENRPSVILTDRSMPGARWFPDVTINWAQHAMQALPPGIAIVERSQTRGPRSVNGPELRELVASVQGGLVNAGVRRGDRVAAYLPNCIEAVATLLACGSLGAVFTSCPLEFGAKAVLDRFGQVEPKVLVCGDGYRHRGREIDRRWLIDEIAGHLPTVRAKVLVDYLRAAAAPPGWQAWDSFVAHGGVPEFVPLPFDHPLYVLYTSGTTGLPKPIVHGHGGILVEHLKLHSFHHDLGQSSRFFWYTTTGWVMWNYLVSALLTGASIVLFDGDPLYPDMDSLWSIAEQAEVTDIGVSASFLEMCKKARLAPRLDHDLSAIRQVGSTGSPLGADVAEWVYDAVHPELILVSASGGTDIASAFVAGCPIVPVRAGRISCRCLGVSAHAFDRDGRAVVGVEGELVVTEPMPSMPLSIWGDDDGQRYREAWFGKFAGVWTHGDWVTFFPDGTSVISGRSDATLNRGGVRLGTSDFYSVVDRCPEIVDSLVVHLDRGEAGAGRLILFVVLDEGMSLSGELVDRLNSTLRTALSPRHIPDEIVAISEVPRTATGKKLEIPVKRILSGVPVAEAAATSAMENPEALRPFEEFARARAARLADESTPL